MPRWMVFDQVELVPPSLAGRGPYPSGVGETLLDFDCVRDIVPVQDIDSRSEVLQITYKDGTIIYVKCVLATLALHLMAEVYTA